MDKFYFGVTLFSKKKIKKFLIAPEELVKRWFLTHYFLPKYKVSKKKIYFQGSIKKQWTAIKKLLFAIKKQTLWIITLINNVI